MNHRDCCYELLARSELGHVVACATCGQVHLSMQCMTLRLDADAFRALADMIASARRRIEHAVTADTAQAPYMAPGGLH